MRNDCPLRICVGLPKPQLLSSRRVGPLFQVESFNARARPHGCRCTSRVRVITRLQRTNSRELCFRNLGRAPRSLDAALALHACMHACTHAVPQAHTISRDDTRSLDGRLTLLCSPYISASLTHKCADSPHIRASQCAHTICVAISRYLWNTRMHVAIHPHRIGRERGLRVLGRAAQIGEPCMRLIPTLVGRLLRYDPWRLM